ncbi:glycoside hydrolase family 130 protein [Paenibacillus albus]|uniref:Glycosidase n=1 Tax=Paenibacillus albus TaxID=2495582 RepID=A0A3Q8X7Z3_9BACL|nr:glycosidase [Paenibacillus albus]AZN42420.1 glycosidase [Paenibacillus albus]
MKITRCESNPIVTPGLYDWRKATVFNPAVIIEGDKFYMIERTAGSLDPFQCFFGLLESEDGVNFKHVLDKPIIHPEQFGFPYGSIQDPRVVKLDDTFYLNYALRPCSMSYYPTGVGIPNNSKPVYPDGWGEEDVHWRTRSSIATSKDLINWEFLCDTTPLDINDRDNILFPEKIGGKYALLRRPEEFIGEAYGTEKPAMWISYSEDLITWEDPILFATVEQEWELKKIGGSTPPIKTDKGWLVLYHGVGPDHIYRVGAMLLDLEQPEKVVARAPGFIMEPETYYEKFGLFIPNVVFPTANVVKDGLLYIYYGATDTAICLATVPLDELVDYVIAESEKG